MIQLASSTEAAFRVLVSRRHVVHRDSTTRVYRVECFLSLPLDPLVTLSSSHFTRGKIASECDVTFERYRMMSLKCVQDCAGNNRIQYMEKLWRSKTLAITLMLTKWRVKY